MEKQFEQSKRRLLLKKQKIIGLSYAARVMSKCYMGDPSDPPHTTTKTTTTLGDTDVMVIAYLTM